MLFQVKVTDGLGKIERLINEMPKRVAYVREMALRKMVEMLRDEIHARVPKGKAKEWDAYLESLVIEQVMYNDNSVSLLVLKSHPPETKLKERKPDKTLVEFSPYNEQKLTAMDRVMIELGPWTVDTIPGMPSKRVRAVYRNVSAREVKLVRNRLRKNWGDIERQILKAGGKKQHLDTEAVGSIKGVDDMALVGLRLEFGLDGYPHIAHWKPGLLAVRKNFVRALVRDRRLIDQLLKLEVVEWRQAPRRLKQAPLAELAKYQSFTKKVRGS